MRNLLLILVILVACVGCQTYHERFTYIDPASGATNHVVDVSWRTCLVMGKAGQLRTTTQTMEFIREVNAVDAEMKPDADSIKAIADGIVQAILNAASQGAVP